MTSHGRWVSPGGSWLDNQIAFNPQMEKSDFQLSKINGNLVHPTAFRVSGPMATGALDGLLGENASDFNREIIVVDGTRCQKWRRVGDYHRSSH